MRTGTRCTTLIQLPVAFCAGSKEKALPVPADNPCTLPRKVTRLPYKSDSMVTGWPMRILRNWFSLKLASTHTSCSGTTAITGMPAGICWPTCTLRLAIWPLIGERI